MKHEFQNFYSCETQLAYLHTTYYFPWNKIFKKEQEDFSKAFDRVPHNYLLSKLAIFLTG